MHPKAIVLWLLTTICVLGDPAAAQIPEALVQKHALPVIKPDSGPIRRLVALFGKVSLHPERTLHLHPRYAGVVSEVLKSVGDPVRQGDVLARIENNVGVQSYDIVSTMAGVVLERAIAPGQAVTEKTAAFTVGDTRLVIADLVAQAPELDGLARGQSVLVKLLNGQAEQVSSLTYIAPILDERTRTGKVVAELRNDAGQWRPGQFLMGHVAKGETPVAVRIPRAVVGDETDTAQVYVRVGSVFESRRVRLGRGDEAFVEVTSGLSTQDEILEKAGDALRAVQAEKEPRHDHD